MLLDEFDKQILIPFGDSGSPFPGLLEFSLTESVLAPM